MLQVIKKEQIYVSQSVLYPSENTYPSPSLYIKVRKNAKMYLIQILSFEETGLHQPRILRINDTE